MVSINDAAKLLGVSRSTIWRFVQEKRIEVIHLGARQTVIRIETINRIAKEGIPEPQPKHIPKER